MALSMNKSSALLINLVHTMTLPSQDTDELRLVAWLTSRPSSCSTTVELSFGYIFNSHRGTMPRVHYPFTFSQVLILQESLAQVTVNLLLFFLLLSLKCFIVFEAKHTTVCSITLLCTWIKLKIIIQSLKNTKSFYLQYKWEITLQNNKQKLRC